MKYFIWQREFAEETLVQLLHHIEKKGRRDTKNELTIVVLLNLRISTSRNQYIWGREQLNNDMKEIITFHSSSNVVLQLTTADIKGGRGSERRDLEVGKKSKGTYDGLRKQCSNESESSQT